MSKKPGPPPELIETRGLAERKLREKGPVSPGTPTLEMLQKLHHELQVHQIELEMQNEKLRQALEEAEESRENFRELYEFAPISYLTLDPHGSILAVNLTGATLLATERSRLLGRPFDSFLDENPARFRKFLTGVFAGVKMQAIEVPLKTAGDAELHVRLEAKTNYSRVSCLVALIDMTDRRQEELFHLQLECVQGYAIFLLDTQGKILNWNAGAERLKGYRSEEIVGRNVSCLYSEQDRAAGKPELDLKKAAAEGRFSETCWQIRKNGSRFWAEMELTPLRNGKGHIWGFSKVTHDITDRKKVEEALSYSEARYRALFEGNPTMILTLDTGWTVLSANQSAALHLGYPRDELEGQSVLQLFHQEDRAAVAEQFQNCLQTPNEVHRWQFRKVRKDGEVLWVEETAQAIFATGETLVLLVVCQDITARRRAEAERERILMQLETVLENLNEAVVVTDLSAQVLSMNRAALLLYGYPPDEVHALRPLADYLDGFEITDLEGRPLPFEDWPLVRAIHGESFANCELRVRRKDTGKAWIGSYNGSQVRSSSNEISLAVVAVRDITERKLAEQRLREIEEKFYKVFSLAPIGMTISTLSDGRFIEINAAGERLSGFPRDEVIGRNSAQFSIWRDASERARTIAEVVEKGEVRDREMKMKGKAGHDFWGLFSAVIIEIKGEKHLLSLVSDIDERKRAQDALRESEERFRLMADTAPVLIWMAGPDSLCSFFNKSWLEFTGRSIEKELGTGWMEGVHPEDLERCREAYWAAFHGRREFQREYRLRHADGGYRWIADTGVPRITPDGGFVGFIGSCFDVTERKLAEQEIRRLNTSLRQRAAELEAVNEDLEAFNYTVAHDLRQPLNIINSCCQVVEMLYGEKLEKECKEHIELAYRTTLRMDRLIEALLNFSRIGHLEPNRESVDLGMLAREVSLSLLLSEPERTVDFRIAEGIMASVDSNLFRVVFSNLLGNAMKYTSAREKAVIEFGVTEIEGAPAYFVRDNGVGFETADACHLFTPFRRLPGAEKQRGFGIGLATVERIIQRHGGKVWAEGEPEKGACFYFTLSVN
jgi:PAS domain S-box-containing protein